MTYRTLWQKSVYQPIKLAKDARRDKVRIVIEPKPPHDSAHHRGRADEASFAVDVRRAFNACQRCSLGIVLLKEEIRTYECFSAVLARQPGDDETCRYKCDCR